MNSLLAKEFSDIAKAIYSWNDEYWIIIPEGLAEVCYEKYFELLDSKVCDYFELRAITEKELEGLLYLEPVKVWYSTPS